VNVGELAAALAASRGVAHKADIRGVVDGLRGDWLSGSPDAVAVGDDCAAIADGNGGYLLLAIEGLLEEFVERDPWFAGYASVMVNVSDVYAMGGRPIAVVDALWDRDAGHARELVAGMAAAARAYGVPVVGGHTNLRARASGLAVAVLGRAARLMTSFDARPGDVLIAAVDTRGGYREPDPFWDASSGAEPGRLRADLEVLAALAESGRCRAAKDVSNAGLLGTVLMLLECSGVGAIVDVEAVPVACGADPLRWLLYTFPSFGFLCAAAPGHQEEILGAFRARGIAASAIGRIDDRLALRLKSRESEAIAWDFSAAPLMGLGPRGTAVAARVDGPPGTGHA
jgi:uncharacterized protein